MIRKFLSPFATGLLFLAPVLLTLGDLGAGVWGRAKVEYDRHIATV